MLKLLPLRKVPLLGAHWGGRFAERDECDDKGASQLAKGRDFLSGFVASRFNVGFP